MPENEDINSMGPAAAAGVSVPVPQQQPSEQPVPVRPVSSQPAVTQQPSAASPSLMPQEICPQCHLPVDPRQYYCPNCGKNLREGPLSVSTGMEIGIYIWSIILPLFCFISISRWPAIKYLRYGDARIKRIGMIAIALLALSTIISGWLAIVWIQNYVQSSVNDIGNLGGLGGF